MLVIERARRASGLTQQELAVLAHTSRTTVSAYEHGHKTPSLATAMRLIRATGHDLDLVEQISFEPHHGGRGRIVEVPTSLPRLPLPQALGLVTLPLHLNWSTPGRTYDLGDRKERARTYEMVLREGTPEDVLTYIDGALLVDLWPELVLPRDVRAAWTPVVTAHR